MSYLSTSMYSPTPRMFGDCNVWNVCLLGVKKRPDSGIACQCPSDIWSVKRARGKWIISRRLDTWHWVGLAPTYTAKHTQSNMRELAEDNLAFQEDTQPGVLGIQSKFRGNQGFEERRASELTESVLRYSRRDQHLVHVSILDYSPWIGCELSSFTGCNLFVVVESSLRSNLDLLKPFQSHLPFCI